MAFELPTVERNSEGKVMWVPTIASFLALLVAAGKWVLESGTVDQWPLVVTIVGAIIGVTAPIVTYMMGRPAKHQAMANRVNAQANLLAAENGGGK